MDIERLRLRFKGEIVSDQEILGSLSSDFGNLIRKLPGLVAVPADERDIEALLEWANRGNWPVTIRGSGFSQNGQSLSEGGVILDLVNLNRTLKIDRNSIWVETGITWRALIDKLADRGVAPPVLTSNLDTTVGGTLSIGGIGAASHRFGIQADHVEAFEVVTGAGELVQCSQKQNPSLFNAIRCGLGQFGVITKAKLRLRKALPHVRTFFLLYDDLSAVIEDQKKISLQQQFDFVEGWCMPCMQGLRRLGDETRIPFAEWFFPVHLSVEYADTPPLKSLLSGLSYYRLVHIEDYSAAEFYDRMEDIYQIWRESGNWKLPHPWMEVILPWDQADEYIQGVLKSLPPTILDGGQVVILPCRGGISNASLFMHPEGDLGLFFGILPAVPRHLLGMAASLMNKASDLGILVGGKRYLSGWIDFDHQDWKEHFGDRWDKFVQIKMLCDPNQILNPDFIDFGDHS